MTTYAGVECTKKQIQGTLATLRRYREFRFLRDEGEPRKDYNDNRKWASASDKREAQERLMFLINTAINRKAGIPDNVFREERIELWRDCELVQHLIHRNNPSGLQWRWYRMRKFRTRYMQKRYGYLLANQGFEED